LAGQQGCQGENTEGAANKPRAGENMSVVVESRRDGNDNQLSRAIECLKGTVTVELGGGRTYAGFRVAWREGVSVYWRSHRTRTRKKSSWVEPSSHG
jgi:hypothetical protein